MSKEQESLELSEELGLVKRTCEIYVDSLKQRDLIGYDIIEKQINEALDTIKQALLKAQEPKKYLKWEDLEFTAEEQTMKVKLNNNIYTMVYYSDEVCFDTVSIDGVFIDSCSQQFFNDLHLKRVEE